MPISSVFDGIQEKWIQETSTRLACGDELRDAFSKQISRYYRLLKQSVVTGDAKWMRPILREWLQAHTQREMDGDQISLAVLLNDIFSITFKIARQELPPESALIFIESILAVHSESLAFITRQEAHYYLEYFNRKEEIILREMEEFERSKSDFISIAAHELKTPLTLIEGYKDMLGGLPPGHVGQGEELLKGVTKGTRRLREIIDDMIVLSLIKNRLLELSFQSIRLDRVVLGAVKQFEETFLDRSIHLDMDRFHGMETPTYGDEEKLQQVFKHLLSNAVKYTPDGRSISISGRLLPGFVEITITDSGIGIDEVKQAQIFKTFAFLGRSQQHSSGKTKYKGGGPGLGLPITRGIITAHGGTIWLDSEGHDEELLPGTTAHILFPVHRQPPDHETREQYQYSYVRGYRKNT